MREVVCEILRKNFNTVFLVISLFDILDVANEISLKVLALGDRNF